MGSVVRARWSDVTKWTHYDSWWHKRDLFCGWSHCVQWWGCSAILSVCFILLFSGRVQFYWPADKRPVPYCCLKLPDTLSCRFTSTFLVSQDITWWNHSFPSCLGPGLSSALQCCESYGSMVFLAVCLYVLVGGGGCCSPLTFLLS